MRNISQQIDQRRGNILFGVAVLCAVASFFMAQFSYELCHSGIPLTVLIVAIPGLGASCAFVALFFASSSPVLTAMKAVVVSANLYMLAWAGILLTGLEVLNCG